MGSALLSDSSYQFLQHQSSSSTHNQALQSYYHYYSKAHGCFPYLFYSYSCIINPFRLMYLNDLKQQYHYFWAAEMFGRTGFDSVVRFEVDSSSQSTSALQSSWLAILGNRPVCSDSRTGDCQRLPVTLSYICSLCFSFYYWHSCFQSSNLAISCFVWNRQWWAPTSSETVYWEWHPYNLWFAPLAHLPFASSCSIVPSFLAWSDDLDWS